DVVALDVTRAARGHDRHTIAVAGELTSCPRVGETGRRPPRAGRTGPSKMSSTTSAKGHQVLAKNSCFTKVPLSPDHSSFDPASSREPFHVARRRGYALDQAVRSRRPRRHPGAVAPLFRSPGGAGAAAAARRGTAGGGRGGRRPVGFRQLFPPRR